MYNIEEDERSAKVIFIGDTGVGKTCLMNAIVTGSVVSQTTPTIGSYTIQAEYNIDDKIVLMQLWDTCGQEKFESLTKTYFRDTHVAVLVFDLSEPSSYNSLRRWKKDVEEFSINSKFIIVGNKCDKDHSFTKENVENEYQDCPVFFVSSYQLINLNLLSESIAQLSDKALDEAIVVEKPIEAIEKKKCC